MNHVDDIPVFHQLYMSRVTTKLSFVGVSLFIGQCLMPEFVILSDVRKSHCHWYEPLVSIKLTLLWKCWDPTRVLGDLGRRVIYFSGIWRANKLFWGYREQ